MLPRAAILKVDDDDAMRVMHERCRYRGMALIAQDENVQLELFYDIKA